MIRSGIVFKKKELIYIVVAILLFFQIYLQNTIQLFQYFDEFITVFCLYQIAMYCIGKRIAKNNFHIMVVIFFIFGVGLIGNFIANIQTGIIPIMTDIGNSFKVFIVYVGSSIYSSRGIDKEKIIKLLAKIMRFFVMILFICMVGHEIGLINMGADIRYGLRSFEFINNGAGQLSMMFYSLLLVLTVDLQYGSIKKIKWKKIFISMALIVWISTLRSRAFMYVLIYCILYWKLIIKNEKFKLNITNGILILIVLLFFGIDQFETYFSNTATARSNLMRYGIYTMLRYFPIGAGFATFGTDAAHTYYSKLYTEYGFEYVYGLSRMDGKFSHDTYWAAIFAQFGVIGTIFMITLIILWCKDILKKTKYNKIALFAGIFLCITQVTSSVATATFFNFVTVGTFFLIPLLFENTDIYKRGIANEHINN